MEEIQGAAACSFSPPPILQDLWSCVCVYCSCFRKAMIHSSWTWSLTKPDQQHLQRNDRAMISQICNVKPEDVAIIRSNKLLVHFEIDYLKVILRKGFACLSMLNDSVAQLRHFAKCRKKEGVGQGGQR